MALKFVGGPKHGQDVPDWAYGCSELYVEDRAVRRPDNSWEHLRVRYSRHTLDLSDVHQVTFLAPLDAMQQHEIVSATRPLLNLKSESTGGGAPSPTTITALPQPKRPRHGAQSTCRRASC